MQQSMGRDLPFGTVVRLGAVRVLSAATGLIDRIAMRGHAALVKLERIVVTVAMCIAASCSSSSSVRADPLAGVSVAKAIGLCSDFAPAANALSAAQNTIDTSSFDAAEGTFATLATKARAAEFARRLDDVSVAVRLPEVELNLAWASRGYSVWD